MNLESLANTIFIFNAITSLLRIALLVLAVLALIKYLRGRKPRQQEQTVQQSLGEVLKSYRTKADMTQEFVAEAMGVSRQAVSKWENGTADPSTSNLLKLARLYGVSPEELIRSIRPEQE